MDMPVRKRVRKSKNKKINPYVFYCLVFIGVFIAGILLYQIYILFHQVGGPDNIPHGHVDLSGVH
jgi:uncharacterized membrane protein SpoIIM required for sporulation